MFSQFINDYLYAIIAIFPMINPIAMSSVFYGMTQKVKKEDKKKLASIISLYGTALLLGTLLIGPFILKFFGLQTADIRIAGGLVVFAIAWKMLNKPYDDSSEENCSNIEKNDDIFSKAFFPLTMPLTAGAGSIAIVIALATQAEKSKHFLVHYLSIGAAVITIFYLVNICYRFSDSIFNLLGKSGTKAVTSLSAFILLAIGVSVIWSGIKILVPSS